MKTLKEIYNIFPDINWKGLNYTNYPRIRFYFSSNENKLPILLGSINDLLKNLFGNNDIYVCLILFGNKRLSNNTINSLKLREIYNVIENSNEILINKSEDSTKFLYFTKVNFKVINKINKAILEKDFGIKPELYLNCFYFNFDKKLLINLYDDRGMDIISTNDYKNNLNNIYDSFKGKFKIKFE